MSLNHLTSSNFQNSYLNLRCNSLVVDGNSNLCGGVFLSLCDNVTAPNIMAFPIDNDVGPQVPGSLRGDISWPRGGFLRNLRVKGSVAYATANTLVDIVPNPVPCVCSVFVNGLITPLTVTIPAGATVFDITDSTHIVTLPDNATCWVAIDTSAGVAGSINNFHGSLELF